MCQNCGTQLPDGTPMCPTCGAQLFAAQPQQAYMNPNQNYNQQPYGQTPYGQAPYGQAYGQAPYGAAPAKKSNTGLIIGIIIAIIAVAAIVVAIVLLNKDKDDEGDDRSSSKKKSYDGTYTFEYCEINGQSFTAEELEGASGRSFNMSLIVKGDKCTVDAEDMGMTKGTCKIEFDGTNVTLVDSSETLYGTYDPDEESITLSSQGVDMTFVKD